ncbi:MAG: hypothetical protein E7354_05780 [Clostridiales bacterium]|nr:hypothetical protein [Clostridiales bacterium]
MAKFRDRVKGFTHLDRITGKAGKTANITFIQPCEANAPIYMELSLAQEGKLTITAYSTNLPEKYPNVTGGFELYKHIAQDNWDFELSTNPIGYITVSNSVNRHIVEDMHVITEYQNSALRESLIKTVEDVGRYMGWEDLYVSSYILGKKKHKKSSTKSGKSTFEILKERLFGVAHEEDETPRIVYPDENYDVFKNLGYVDAIKDNKHSPNHVPMKIKPHSRGTLQPDILETLTGIRLNGDVITDESHYTPRFQFAYRIMDTNFNDLIANPSASK